MRKSFWDLATEFAGFENEALSINKLFENTDFYFNNTLRHCTIKDFIEQYHYQCWALEKSITFASVASMMEYLDINDMSFRIKGLKKHITLEKFLLYIETVYNLISIKDVNHHSIISTVFQIRRNIEVDCERLGFEVRCIENEKFIIVEKNAAATAVADKYANSDLDFSFKVIEYNHFLLKGNIDRKREILLALGQKFESVVKQLAASPFKNVADDTGYLLNNLNIRHDNTSPGSKSNKPFVAQMPPEELEAWYDKTYSVLLLALLADDFPALHKEVQELKAQMESK